MTARHPRPLSFEEYLLVDEASAERNEFQAGAIYAMSGGSARHARISANLVAGLTTRLMGKRCQALGSDLRVYIEAAQLAAYPDVAAYCGPVETWKTRSDVALNPSLVVEVLSPSTQAFDRGEKFEAYKRVPSLRDYVLVAQDKAVVEIFSRAAGDVWVPSMVRGMGACLPLPSVEVTLPLAEVYAGVDLDAE